MNAILRRILFIAPALVGLVLLAMLWPQVPKDVASPSVVPEQRAEVTPQPSHSIIPAAQAVEPAVAAAGAAAPQTARSPVPVPLPLPLEDPPVFRLFNQWAATYVNAKPSERAAIIPAGVALAAERRQALAELIPADPQRALGLAVPFVIRQKLPPEVVEKLEERVSAKAFFGVLATPPDGRGGPTITREVRLESGKSYKAYVFGRRLTQPTTQNATIAGIAVDRVMAVDHRPLRVLEVGEVPERGKPMGETRTVSARTAVMERTDGQLPTIAKQTRATEGAGTIRFLRAASRVRAFEEQPDPLAAGADAAPVMGMEHGAVTLTYRRPVNAGDLIYEVEQSLDLAQTWMPATPAEQILSEENGARVIRASVAIDGTPQLILRLRITRP